MKHPWLLTIALVAVVCTSAFAGNLNISSLTPNSGAVGASVTIAGSGFGSSQGSSTVTFNGTKATTITSWGSGSIVAVVPSGATTGNVVVTVSGKQSNGVLFTVVPAPVISSLSPPSGAVGVQVTISGSNFGASQGSGSVSFNGTQATINSWGAMSIVATIPSGATTGNVVVFASGVNSNGISFTVWPSISSLSPGFGPVGTPITIGGLNFGSTQGSSTVTFNGVTAAVSSWSSSSISTVVPNGATTGNVIVTVGGMQAKELGLLSGSCTPTYFTSSKSLDFIPTICTWIWRVLTIRVRSNKVWI